jgi:glutathione S-transferase
MKLTLISHALCPYVQRAAIAMAEKGIGFDQRVVDLANKPQWFLDVSPLGKTPVLLVAETAIFESAVILEYLEDTGPHPLHPAHPLRRAEHRSWIEFGSSVLNDIAGFYNAPDATAFAAKRQTLRDKFLKLENRLTGPFFDGERFSLVDTVFAPVFRYFDAFDAIAGFGILDELPKLAAWRQTLSSRASVAAAVDESFPRNLLAFLARRGSYLSKQLHIGS